MTDRPARSNGRSRLGAAAALLAVLVAASGCADRSADSDPAPSIATAAPMTSPLTSSAVATASTESPPDSATTAAREPAGTGPGSIVQRLSGRTFVLRSTFVDGGARNLITRGLDFTMTFSGSTATVTGDCTLRYTVEPVENPGRFLLGEPQGRPCEVGENPQGPPVGNLGVSLEGTRLVLGNDTAWIFDEVR